MCVLDPLTALEAYHHTHLSCIDTVEVILSDWRDTGAGDLKGQRICNLPPYDTIPTYVCV